MLNTSGVGQNDQFRQSLKEGKKAMMSKNGRVGDENKENLNNRPNHLGSTDPNNRKRRLV